MFRPARLRSDYAVTLEQQIRDEIRERGPLSFDRFMDLALYHPTHGYYASGNTRVGWEGDFVTSPELDPAFGELWAAAFEEVWVACKRPQPFHLIEVGPGTGRFAAAVLDAASAGFSSALQYHLVERAPAAARAQRKRIPGDAAQWHATIADVPAVESGCWFANEVLDNLPVRLVERRHGETRELLVDAADGSLGWIASLNLPAEIRDYFDALGRSVPEGHRAEAGIAATELARLMADKIDQGAVIFVDYGDSAEGLLERPGGTLLCYSRAGIDDRPLEAPGTKDITVHANWSAIGAALESAGLHVAGPVTQASVLRRLGLGRIEAALADDSRSTDPARVVRALSRRGAVATLVDPTGPGGFGVLAGIKGCEPPPFV